MADSKLTYRDAGVDIDAGNELVRRIGPAVNRTRRAEVLAGLGGFGGLFALDTERFDEPVLVAGTDGVGTKLLLAKQLGRHTTIGIDLVAMCVNDIVVQGAEPLFFLDYFACGQLNVGRAEQVVAGIARGCELAGCALIGGETAEMPGMYAGEDYDLGGFAVGAVNRRDLIDGSRIRAGNTLIGLGSSGPHSNGYSLIRYILRSMDADLSMELDGGQTLQDALLEPTRIYARTLLELMREVPVHGLVHISGGGLPENVPRVLPEGLVARIFSDRWQRPPVFDWLQRNGDIATEEMYRTFNCGIGMVVVVPREYAETALQVLRRAGETAWQLGRIEAGERGVQIA